MRKGRKKSKTWTFWCFGVFLVHIFARNVQLRSKSDEVKVDSEKIDPRGSHGARNSEIRSYCAGQLSKIVVFEKFATLWTFLTCEGPKICTAQNE